MYQFVTIIENWFLGEDDEMSARVFKTWNRRHHIDRQVGEYHRQGMKFSSYFVFVDFKFLL